MHVRFTLDPGLHHLVKRPLGLYLVNEHRARVPRLMLPDGAYPLDYLGVVLVVPSQREERQMVAAVDAGSRYGIRYDQAIILKQKQIERDHKRQIDALVDRVESLESKLK